jgi:hypothetical protein
MADILPDRSLPDAIALLGDGWSFRPAAGPYGRAAPPANKGMTGDDVRSSVDHLHVSHLHA